MKELDRHDIEIPEQFSDLAPGIRLEFRRLEMQTGSDHIEIHIFQPDGAEQHRKSVFKVLDDDEGRVAFLRSNHNEPEPYQMALFGLGLEGFETKRDWELDHTEEYQNRAQLNFSHAMLILDDAEEMHPFEQRIFEEAATLTFIVGGLYEFQSRNDRPIGEIFDEEGIEAAISRLDLGGDEQVVELVRERFKDYVKRYMSDQLSTDTDDE